MDKHIYKRLKYFIDNYDVITKYDLDGYKKIFLGSKGNKVCRFCGKSEPEVSFRMEAHAIPELIGNKHIFTYYECDNCNKKFSNTLEDHLANYLSIWRVLMQIKGKKGIPKYKKGDTKMYFDSERIRIETSAEQPIITINNDNNELEVEGIRDPYIPIAVYKCFVKMALSILPESELDRLKWAIEWVGEEDHSKSRFSIKPIKLFSVFTPGPNMRPYISMRLFKRKPIYDFKVPLLNTVPYIIFVIEFKNFLYQINLMDFNKECGMITKNVLYGWYPVMLGEDYEYGKVQCSYDDLSSTEVIKGKKVKISMHYEDIIDVVSGQENARN